jgi:formylglycine-generating enzyme required for sulfatase activity
MKPDPTTAHLCPEDDQLLRDFAISLRPVAEDCSKLVMQGITFSCGRLDQPLPLAHVYVGLETLTSRPEREPQAARAEAQSRLTALEVLFAPDQPKVVLVGDPGSGKSTFLQYVTLCLADGLCVAAGMPSQIPNHPIPALLRAQRLVPLRILLRELAPELDAAHRELTLTSQVKRFLERKLGTEAQARLDLLLKRGLAFILFDGLDEVPRPRLPAVKQAITEFTRTDYYRCRVAVTSRTRSYELAEFQLEGFPKPHEIAPLSGDLQAQFIQAWYAELEKVWSQQYAGQGAACAALLRDELSSDTLKEMATNPFFLTCMAALHSPEKQLPDNSAELLHLLVNGILQESRRAGTGTGAGARPGELEIGALLDRLSKKGRQVVEELRLALQAVAYECRVQRSDPNSRTVDEALLYKHLALGEGADGPWIKELLQALRHRAGVLHSKDGGPLEFAYRFEEFLAGCHLANADAWGKQEGEKENPPSFAARCLDLFQKQKDYARQVVLWAAGMNAHVHAASGGRGQVRELLEVLLDAPAPSAPPRRSLLQRFFGVAPSGGPPTEGRDLTHWELAAEIARDTHPEQWSEKQVPGTDRTVGRLRERLETVRDQPERFPIGDRSRAASAIGRVGDLREGVGLWPDEVPRLQFVPAPEPLPGGPFLLQSQVEQQPIPGGQMVVASTATPHGIPHPYRISRYPVTVAQYRAFVAAGGYDARKAPQAPVWWGEEGWAWRLSNRINGPAEYDPVFQTPNHPRVGVSWYEATAFCAWLTQRWRETGRLGQQGTIRLPHETEWEQAARWDGKRADDRYFPWAGSKKGDPEAALNERCNWVNTGLGHTSAVGLFPMGEAACGALDLAGNVWAWCDNWYDSSQNYRVVRGGSWADGSPGRLSVSCRYNGHPGGRGQNRGFRCVVVGGVAAAG